MIFSLALLALQVTPVAPIVKGTALPPDEATPAEVLAPVQRMFAAITRHDAAALRAEVRAEGGATAAVERSDGTRVLRRLSWDQFTSAIKPGPQRHEERFVGQPAVEIDGDIAMVWGDYVFLVDGKIQHCGVDHFDLVRENGAWKVLNVTWTQRTTGCVAS